MERRQTRRWTLWRCPRGRVFWRINVPSRNRCFEGRSGRVGAAFARKKVYSSRYAVAHAASRSVRCERDRTEPLLAPAHAGGGIVAQVLRWEGHAPAYPPILGRD